MGIHDVYEIEDHPYRTPIMIMKASDRIGKPYVEVDADRIKGIIECNIPDEARAFKAPDAITTQIGNNVADFLLANLKSGKIPPTFLNLQSGVGSGANAVLGALGQCPDVPNFSIYTEVLQDAPRTTDARRPRTLGISLFAHRDERMSARHLQRHGLLQRQARAPSFRNFKQPRSHRPHRRMLSEYGHRGGHLRTCKLYQDLRYEDDERYRRFGRLHQQCLFEHFHLRFHPPKAEPSAVSCRSVPISTIRAIS